MKDIVIVANFTQVPGEKGNNRFAYLADILKDRCKTELITSSFSHNLKRQREAVQNETDTGVKVTQIFEPGYSRNISLKRFYSHWVWGRNVRKYLKNREKPDAIYCAVPSLTAPLMVGRYCQRNHIKFIIDVQDLWPEAFKMVLHIPVVSDIIFAPFNWIANGIYKRADEIVAVSDAYVHRALAVNRKCQSGHAIYLGTKLKTFDEAAAKVAPLYQKKEDEVLLGYCGSLSASYDIANLIYAVKKLEDKGIDGTKLVIMGDGGHRQLFEDISRETGVDACFTGQLSYEQMCAQLKACDIVINPIRSGSVASIINKHGDYAASGLPVVNSQDSPEYRELVVQYHMGLNCNNEDADDMAEKLEQLILNPQLRLEMGKNARKCAEERFDREFTYREILKILQV